jgi:hypothetical protein
VVRAGSITRTSLWYATGATDGDRLRTAASVVGDGKRAGDTAGGARCEGYIEGAIRSGCEAAIAGTRLAEIGRSGDIRDIQRRCAVIAQSDGLRRTGCAYDLVAKIQAAARCRN